LTGKLSFPFWKIHISNIYAAFDDFIDIKIFPGKAASIQKKHYCA
jgi:hypothetical protein